MAGRRGVPPFVPRFGDRRRELELPEDEDEDEEAASESPLSLSEESTASSSVVLFPESSGRGRSSAAKYRELAGRDEEAASGGDRRGFFLLAEAGVSGSRRAEADLALLLDDLADFDCGSGVEGTAGVGVEEEEEEDRAEGSGEGATDVEAEAAAAAAAASRALRAAMADMAVGKLGGGCACNPCRMAEKIVFAFKSSIYGPSQRKGHSYQEGLAKPRIGHLSTFCRGFTSILSDPMPPSLSIQHRPRRRARRDTRHTHTSKSAR